MSRGIREQENIIKNELIDCQGIRKKEKEKKLKRNVCIILYFFMQNSKILVY